MLQSCESHKNSLEAIIVYEGSNFSHCPVCDELERLNDQIKILESKVGEMDSEIADITAERDSLQEELSKAEE